MLYDPKWNTNKTVANEFLIAAADYMDKHGWCQHNLRDGCGRVCMVGAIGAVTEDLVGTGELIVALTRLNIFLGMSADSWNDDICKTQEQATKALRAAAQ